MGTREALLQQIATLEAELAATQTRLDQARQALAHFDERAAVAVPTPAPPAPPAAQIPLDASGHVDAHSDGASKIALFMERFVGRRDVFATRWVSRKSGKAGWSPAVRGGFYDERRPQQDYLPLTTDVVARHLTGAPATDGPPNTHRPNQQEFHVGLYPMLRDDTCHLLVCDFDDGTWAEDARTYVHACTDAGIQTLAEISRSGSGAHVWMFFRQPIRASTARKAGQTLLHRAMAKRPQMDFGSYDRFFPSQDFLPRASFGRSRLGNLIALPLQGDCRRRGTTVFADPETWQPLPDQFAALSRVTLVDEPTLTALAGAADQTRIGPAEHLPPRPRRSDLGKLGRAARAEALREVTVELDSSLHIPTGQLPGPLITELKHLSSVPNPEFFRKQAQRFSTFGTPRYVTCFEHDDAELRLPRGLLHEAVARLADAGVVAKVKRKRRRSARIDVSFAGELRRDQQLALREVAKHDMGVLVAPPGTGKTVMACALIARRKLSTAILVNRAELLQQWRERLTQFLSIDEAEIGQLGAGRRKLKGTIDLIMMQSIAHRNGDPTVLNGYGQIIVDECHAIAAPAVEAALKQVNVRHWLGLTATPYRADRMDGLITMQCGPIRHTMESASAVPRELRIHRTAFETELSESDVGGIQAIYNELAVDRARNQLIIDEVVAACADGRRSLVLTNRLDHVEVLASRIAAAVRDCGDIPVVALHGRLSPAERKAVRTQLVDLAEAGDVFVLVAMDKVAGEGFDLPSLNTVFLAVPVSFKGKIIQHIGRATRGDTGEGLSTVVHDFHDLLVPVLDRMHRRRRRVIEKEGFIFGTADTDRTPSIL